MEKIFRNVSSMFEVMVKSSSYVVLEKVTVLKQRNLFELVRATRKDSRGSGGSTFNLLLPAGVYIVSLTGPSGTLNKKLIVH